MASTSKKQISPSPAAQRKSRKTNKVNLDAKKNDEITVVGIGASAGGLKALQEFFEALPSDTGMAYVVITHLHRNMKVICQNSCRGTRICPSAGNRFGLRGKRSCVCDPSQPAHLVMEDGQIDLSRI